MCGIAGYFLFNQPNEIYQQKLKNASKTLALRGPDHEGFFFHQQIGLAHRRLSIIDTSSSANQPFAIDNRYTIIFNGEIFNYKQLQTKYLAVEKLNTTSDTEVLLRLFIRYGTKCFEWLNGFFAFAIYDLIENKLTIARDRFGKKPLLFFYYSK